MDADLSHWDNLAHSYHRFIESGDLLREQLINPLLLQWLGDVNGKRILDAGCGQGYFSHMLAERGAIVEGIDGSAKLISLASETYSHTRITFRVHNLKKQLPFSDAAFETVVCALVLMDFDPIHAALSEFARVLPPNGELLIIIPHPSFFSASRVYKTLFAKLFRRIPHHMISRYHTPYAREWYIHGAGGPITLYHRPLDYYAHALRGAGFVISDIKEPVLSEKFARDKNNFLKLAAEVPVFLGIHAPRTR